MHSWPRIVGRHPVAVLVAALLVCAAFIGPASRLELRADLPSLLPESSPAAQAYRRYLETFGNHQLVFVILSGAPQSRDITGQILADAAFDMADQLLGSVEITEARAGFTIEDELRFFHDQARRAPLLLPDESLTAIADRLQPESIRSRVHTLRSQLVSPAGSAFRQLAAHDPLGFSSELRSQIDASQLVGIDPLTMAFLSSDGRHSLIIAKPRASELDAAAGRGLVLELQQALSSVELGLNVDLDMQAIGGPLYAAHDETAIRLDLKKTVSSTAVACGSLLIATFAGVGIPIAAVLALAAGLIWLAGGLALTIGGVSMVVIGFAAVLIGLGIDITIHGGSCYRRQRLTNASPEKAIAATFSEVGPAVLTATTTTVAAFAVLLASRLPSFQELGMIVAFGLVAITLASASIGAAAAVSLDRAHFASSPLWTTIGRFVNGAVTFAESYPKAVVGAAALLTMVLGAATVHLRLESNLEVLRPDNNPMAAAERVLARGFGIGEDTATILVHGADLDETLLKAQRVRTAINAADPDIAVLSPDLRLAGPKAAVRRLHALQSLPFAAAAQTLRTELAASGLDPHSFQPGIEALEAFASGEDPGTLSNAQDEQVAGDSDGTVWAALSVRSAPGRWAEGPPPSVTSAVTSADPEALIASAQLLGRDLRQSAAADLRRLMSFGLLLVVVVVTLSFRGQLIAAMLALIPVILGLIWALGIWGGAGRPLDLVCLAVLPVILGLGIDDGLYAVHGAGGVPREIGAAVRRSGRAMVLTTLTTGMGFASLGLSHIPGLRAAAVLVPIAIGTCLATTLIVLPAVASLVVKAEKS